MFKSSFEFRRSQRPVISWRLPSLNVNLASTRYRCLTFAEELEKLGFRNEFYIEGTVPDFDQNLVAIVMVKVFRDSDRDIVQTAKSRGVPVYFDLCDNIFTDLQDKPGVAKSAGLKNAFIQHVGDFDAVITPSRFLAEVLACRFPNLAALVVEDAWNPTKVTGHQLRLTFLNKFVFGHHYSWTFLAVVPLIVARAESKLRSAIEFLAGGIIRFSVFIGGQLKPASTSATVAQVRTASDRRLTEGVPGPVGTEHLPYFIWFGSVGDWGYSGMSDLLNMKMELERAYSEKPFELLIVSNSEDDFKKLTREISVPMRYVEWAPDIVDGLIAKAQATLVPSSDNDFAHSKSSNRSLMALALGCPVVATPTPAVLEIKDAVIVEEHHQNMIKLLESPALRDQLISNFETKYRQQYSAENLARKWAQLVCGPSLSTATKLRSFK